MRTVDLNCDMGESFGAWRMGADAEVLPWVTSVNIACGAHAGDPLTMHHTVAAAVRAGVAVGAHVGLPDLLGFGRRELAISTEETYAMTVTQIGALSAMLRTFDRRMTHVKPHGALYHMLEQSPDLARALVTAIHDVDPDLRVVGRSGGGLLKAARGAGLRTADEAFTDRRYRQDGGLVPRGQPGAVIETPAAALRQALHLIECGKVITIEGLPLALVAETLCVHGDRNEAAVFARELHQGLRRSGISLRAIGD